MQLLLLAQYSMLYLPSNAEQKVHTLQSERSLQAVQHAAGESNRFLSPVNSVLVPACMFKGANQPVVGSRNHEAVSAAVAVEERGHPEAGQAVGAERWERRRAGACDVFKPAAAKQPFR